MKSHFLSSVSAAVMCLVGLTAALADDPMAKVDAATLVPKGIVGPSQAGDTASDPKLAWLTDEECAAAKEKGFKNGDMVKVKSNRGEIKASLVVTKRMKGLDCNGKKVHTVGIPIHWGFIGVAHNGYLSNTLTPYVGDANSQTPEYKAFLVNIEKA